MAGNAGNLLHLDHVFGWDPLPLENGSARKAQFPSHFRWQTIMGTDQCHAIHKGRLPQGSGEGKRNRLPNGDGNCGNNHRMEIGDRIRRARVAAGMSQRELAAAVGVTHGLVGAWESHRKAPGRENLRRIAEVTAINPAALLSDIPDGEAGIPVKNSRELELLRKWRRLSRRQQDNILELLDISASVRRKIEHKREPV